MRTPAPTCFAAVAFVASVVGCSSATNEETESDVGAVVAGDEPLRTYRMHDLTLRVSGSAPNLFVKFPRREGQAVIHVNAAATPVEMVTGAQLRGALFQHDERSGGVLLDLRTSVGEVSGWTGVYSPRARDEWEREDQGVELTLQRSGDRLVGIRFDPYKPQSDGNGPRELGRIAIGVGIKSAGCAFSFREGQQTLEVIQRVGADCPDVREGFYQRTDATP